MVSSWWLVVSFLAGGSAGLLLFALLSVSRGTGDDARPLIAHHRGGLRPDLPGGEA